MRDILVDDNRDVEITGLNDVVYARNRMEYLQNYIALELGHLIDELLGDPHDSSLYARLGARTQTILDNCPAIGSVTSATITDVNTVDNSINIEIHVEEDPNFEIEVGV